MSDTGLHTFELLDANERPHSYMVTEHPAGDGMEIMYELLGLGAPTVLGLAGAALRSEDMFRAILGALSSGDEPSAPGDLADLGGLVAEIDLAKVGAELGRALGSGRAPGLTRRVLARTHRDGKQLSAVFDIAYQANYAELLKAIWKVCQINRFFPLPSMSSSSSNGTTAGMLDSPPAA